MFDMPLEELLWLADKDGQFDEDKERLGVPQDMTLYPPFPMNNR